MDDLFVKPGNQERGWNDPPQFSYSLQLAGSTRSPLSRRGPPTKAAGHQTPPPCGEPTPDQQTTPSLRMTPPMQGITPPPSQPTSSPCVLCPMSSPPLGQDSPMSSPPLGQDSPMSSPPLGQDSVQGEPDLQAVSSVLAQALQACRQAVPRQVCEDMAKRLRLLEDSWKSGRLSSIVKRRMNTLTLEMKSGHWDMADDIHRSLIVDHVTEVSQWMVGIKRLIAESRNLNPELLAFSWSDPVQPDPVRPDPVQPLPVLGNS